MTEVPRRPRGFGRVFPVCLAVGCGSGGASDFVDVGSDDGGVFVLDGMAATGPAAFDAHIERDHVAVTFVTLSCSGACADVEAVGTGGYPPYTVVWSDGSTSATRHFCPAASTQYGVDVTDKGTTGELARAPETVKATLTADVVACPDGGAAPTDAGAAQCSSLRDVSPSGANPYGPWSYGWSASLGAAFSIHTEYLVSPPGYVGLDAWSSGTAGIQLNPGAYVNPGATAVTLSTLTAQPGQFLMHPGPLGQYAIARWTAPQAGSYVVQAVFTGLDVGPTTTDVHVQHDGVDVAAGSINVGGAGNVFQASPSVVVAAGDTIDLAVGYGNNGYNDDSTGVDATVCLSTVGDGG
jgi:hypothetical protein